MLTPDSSLSNKEDFVGDVCMIEIFQQTYEIKCGLCLPENEKKGSCHPRICIGRVVGGRTFGHNRHAIEALGKQTSKSSQ